MEMCMKNKTKSELFSALENEEFVLYYQPQFNLMTSKFAGVESLIRWQHPERGLILPDDFIPLAEESEVIVHIGEWVLRTACQQSKLWRERGYPPIRIAVNISARQLFLQEDFVELILQTLQAVGMNPEHLELELSENIIIHDERIIETVHRLKKVGILIALDDFGTGYSSISHLKKIPIDRIKIDKTFIKDIHTNHGDAAIVQAIIALAASLNLRVVAEGVESLKQLQLLLSQECMEAQGFYFSEPLNAIEFDKFLAYSHQNLFL